MNAINAIIAFVVARAHREEKGATAVEYGLLVALIAAIIIAVVGFLGNDILNAFSGVESAIDGQAGG